MSSLRNNFGDLLEPGFIKIFNDAYEEMPLVFPQLFNVDNSTKQDEKSSGVTGFGLLQQTGEGENIDYEDPVQMYDTSFVHQKYTKGFKISEELFEDDQYNVMKTKPAQLARAARRTAENSAANVFNRAFNTSYLGGDGKPLISTTHPRSDGGSSQSNASATGLTLTEENFETGRIAARQQLDDKGMRIQVMPDTIVVPVDLEKDAEIIVNSTMRPGSADNDMNIYKGKYKVVAWEYLTLNDTMWFLMDKKQSQLQWYWRVKPEFKQDNAFDSGMALFKVRTRFSNGWHEWRGVWGSTGDGAAYAS
jgi:phage major head subunit gpT-like protein